jgi:hypothetical protein
MSHAHGVRAAITAGNGFHGAPVAKSAPSCDNFASAKTMEFML